VESNSGGFAVVQEVAKGIAATHTIGDKQQEEKVAETWGYKATRA